MDLNPLLITALPGPKVVNLKNDYRIEIRFCDSATGATIADCTGESALLISELLENLPSEVLAQFLYEAAPRMVALAKGLS